MSGLNLKKSLFSAVRTAVGMTSVFSGAQKNVSPDFPFESKYVELLDSRMHYVEEGSGDPVLFIHGNPSSSYLWRNIIPYVSPHGRAIAVDLIGMGQSGRPDMDYRFVDHARYLEAFIEKMDLKNVTLVIHDVGAGLGFHYAMRHQSNVKGIAFMDGTVAPLTSETMGFGERQMFKIFRDPKGGPQWVMEDNFFMELAVPLLTNRSLTSEEMDHYRAPWRDKKDRKVLLMWPNQVPLDGQPEDTQKIVQEYRAQLEQSKIPKLLLWGSDGVTITPARVEPLVKAFPNTEAEYIGKAKHFLQEDQPHNIGTALAKWIQKIS